VSFSGIEVEECIAALQSMLDFPEGGIDVDMSGMVWSGLIRVGQDLTPNNFLDSINEDLKKRLSTKEQIYYLLTSISLDKRNLSHELKIFDVKVRFLAGDYASRFKSRTVLLNDYQKLISPTPENYCKVVIRVKSKSPKAAVNKALRAIDLQRALWCLMCNPYMQYTYGGSSFSPLNVIRLGSQHTLHMPSGECATENLWYEPNFVEAQLYLFDNPEFIRKRSRWALRQIEASKYKERLIMSLLRYVRALDEVDPNTSFLRLWGALENITTDGRAEYDSVVRRCSFLFKDTAYHRQLLEHLRVYRNASVHAGEESEMARTHCFQLQYFFVNMIWFHLGSAKYFQSFDDANLFLDLPINQEVLKRRFQLTQKALRFRT
jgi:hypothetical protein